MGKIQTVLKGIGGSILLLFGLGFMGSGFSMMSRGSYPSGYGFANDSGIGFVMILIGIVPTVFGIRIIAKA